MTYIKRISDLVLADEPFVDGQTLKGKDLNKPNMLFKTAVNANYESIQKLLGGETLVITSPDETVKYLRINDGIVQQSIDSITWSSIKVGDTELFDGQNSSYYGTASTENSLNSAITATTTLANTNSSRLDVQDIEFIEVKASANTLKTRVDAFTENGAYDDTDVRALIDGKEPLIEAPTESPATKFLNGNKEFVEVNVTPYDDTQVVADIANNATEITYLQEADTNILNSISRNETNIASNTTAIASNTTTIATNTTNIARRSLSWNLTLPITGYAIHTGYYSITFTATGMLSTDIALVGLDYTGTETSYSTYATQYGYIQGAVTGTDSITFNVSTIPTTAISLVVRI